MKLKWQLPVLELDIKGNSGKGDENFKVSAIPKDLTGKSVLDLASFDGYYSYIAAKRGASPVVAIDSGLGEEIAFGPDKGQLTLKDRSFPNPEEHEKAVSRLYQKYNYLNDNLGVNIHFLPIDVMDMDKIKMNFDIILCFGIYYHIKDIYGLFQKCYDKCKEIVIIEGHAILNQGAPFIYMADMYEIHNDCTNFWTPSPNGLAKLLIRIGFKKIEVVSARGSRILLRAYKEKSK